jgi:hypothetical protein
MITIALFFTNASKKITIILDNFEFGADNLFFQIQLKSVKKILSTLPKTIDVIELKSLENCDDRISFSDDHEINHLATLNAIHFLKGELVQDGRKEYLNLIRKQLEKVHTPIDRLFDEHHFDYIIVPGGIWGSSGIFLKLAQQHKIRVCTFDSGYGILFLNTDGVAAHQTDIAQSFNQIENIHSDKIRSIAIKEIEKRKLGIEKHSEFLPSNQKTPYKENVAANDVGILLLLNIVWDAPALGLHTVFATMADWIVESIEWTLKNSDEIITIRQHPHERIASAKSSDDYPSLIKQKFGNNERIRFISASEDVNTYNLIEKSRFVVTYSTTTSMEAVVMGKVVVNVSSCYYSSLGFVCNSRTKDEYFSYLHNALHGNIMVSEKQKENALKCFYLGQFCNQIETFFNPMPDDFKKWVRMNPEDLFRLDEVKTCIYAIENGIPISLIQHQKNMSRQE